MTHSFKKLTDLYHNYAGRPSMLYYAEKMTKDLGGAKIYIKREDLNHTGSIKLIMYWGQSVIGTWERSIAGDRSRSSTGLQRYGSFCLFGMECRSAWAKEDMERQALNVCQYMVPATKVTGVKRWSPAL